MKLEEQGGGTYVCFGNVGEADIRAILYYGARGAEQVYFHILAIVHSELSARDQDDAVLDVGYVRGSAYRAA